ncbi:MAG: DUF368 domain-containing protein [Clostridiales bacterium]|nr:DUF368 domain-containing protein [Clostridiales bacterium]
MRLIKDILKGILIGIANIIPGVSGGTMAVSMGIYDQIIGSVTNLFKQFKKSMLTLLPYAIGMVIAIVGVSRIIEPMFEKYPLQTGSLFVGLILGGLPIILKKVKGKGTDGIGLILFFFFFALIIGLQIIGQKDSNNIEIQLSVAEVMKLFFIGVLASATMVIPGVSGSMILLTIGYYNPILQTINRCTSALSPFNRTELLNSIGILLPFGLGIVIGIFAIAKLIEFLLSRFEVKTFYAILGLITASPIAIYMSVGVTTINVTSVAVSIVTFGVGFIISFFLGGDESKAECILEG